MTMKNNNNEEYDILKYINFLLLNEKLSETITSQSSNETVEKYRGVKKICSSI